MKGDETEDETTLQCDPSDGIVETVTNVQALVVRVPAYTSWIIELCLISSTVRKAFSCSSQRCDLLWCIYVSMFLIMYIFYLVSFSIYFWSLTCNQIFALYRLSLVLCCHCLCLGGDHWGISCQCLLKLRILLVIQQQHNWDDEIMLIICDHSEDVNWRWYTFAKCLDELEEWAGEVQLHPSH